MTTTKLIVGNTYPVKDQIKALGGKWDAEAKGWRVPVAKAEQAQALVDSVGSKVVRTPAPKAPSQWDAYTDAQIIDMIADLDAAKWGEQERAASKRASAKLSRGRLILKLTNHSDYKGSRVGVSKQLSRRDRAELARAGRDE